MRKSTLKGWTWFFLLGLLITFLGCSKGTSSLVGRWQITEKPRWVGRNYLAYQSDIFQFMKDGSCVWGTAGGQYKAMGKNNMQVSFPMQQATPGYVGVLSYTVNGDKLVLTDVAREGSVVLKRIK